MPDVSVAACAAYTKEVCERALTEVLAPLGGLEWVRPGMRVVIKANLVAAMKPDAAATTHPTLLAALTRLLKRRGAAVVIPAIALRPPFWSTSTASPVWPRLRPPERS